jgi:cellulose synthase/poly-beta-1,6-N-acetylglucosamine synthase-like glycosyltransferase
MRWRFLYQQTMTFSLNGATRSFDSTSARQSGPAPACRVTIIVPTRNRPQLLASTLAHILAQDFAAFEVLVIDDGSSAATRAAYADIWKGLDGRFVLLELGCPDAPGLGPSVARNTGIEAAAGDIITFCDDDDVWTGAHHLATLVDVFDAGSDIDLYIANQSAVACNGKVERRDWLPDLVKRVQDRRRDGPHGYRLALTDLIRAGGFAQLNIVALRKATAVAIGGFWTRTSYEEDRDFYWRAVDAARAVFFNPDIVAQHNVPDPNRQVNLSRSFSQTERWMISAMVSQHIAMSVKNARIRVLCQAYEGDILRRLSQHLSGEGRHALGLQYARRALAARMSLKWAVYTGALMCRQMIRGKAA